MKRLAADPAHRPPVHPVPPKAELRALVIRAAAGDRVAEAEVMKGVDRFVYGMALKVAKRYHLEEHWEEVLQQARLLSVEAVRNFNAEKAADILTYLRNRVPKMLLKFTRGFNNEVLAHTADHVTYDPENPVYRPARSMDAPWGARGDNGEQDTLAETLQGRLGAVADGRAETSVPLEMLDDLPPLYRRILEARFITLRPAMWDVIGKELGILPHMAKLHCRWALRRLGVEARF